MQTNEAQRRRWNDEYFASLWPRNERLTDHVTPLLLDALALQAGERVLDVGSGGGRATLEAARAVGPGGSAVGADVSAPLSQAGDASEPWKRASRTSRSRSSTSRPIRSRARRSTWR